MNRPSSPVKLGGGLFVFSLGWPEFGWGFLGFILVGGDHGDFGAALPVLDLCKGMEASSHPWGRGVDYSGRRSSSRRQWMLLVSLGEGDANGLSTF